VALYASAAAIAGALFVAGAAAYSRLALAPFSPAQVAPVSSPDPALKQEDQRLNLSGDEVALLRAILPPKRTGFRSHTKVGAVAHGKLIMPFIPSSITDKIPRLKGYRYTYDDDSGALWIVSNRTMRIVEIIEAAS